VDNEREAINSSIEKLREEIDKQLLEHGQVIVQLEEEFRQRENLFRETIDESFAEMRDRHQDALTTLVLYRNAEELRADRRASCDVRLLERISISLADRQEFDEAIAISKQAESVHANDVEGRKAALRDNYEKLRRNLLGQFAKEIGLLDERLVTGLQGIRDEHDLELSTQQRQRSVTVQRLVLTAIHEANNKVAKKERETEIGEQVTEFARKRARKGGMNAQFNFE
jgi:hypothetical protein